jgi:hypothetical protein
MSTKEVAENYIAAIHNGGWESYLAEDMVFVSNNLDRVHYGRRAYSEAAGRFFNSTTGCEIRQLVTEGDKAALIVRYFVKSPKGALGGLDVAEFLRIQDNKLVSSTIFFDNEEFGEFMRGD